MLASIIFPPGLGKCIFWRESSARLGERPFGVSVCKRCTLKVADLGAQGKLKLISAEVSI